MEKVLKRELLTETDEENNLTITEETVIPPVHQKRTVWDVDEFISAIYVRFVSESEDKLDIEFDLVNVGAPIANAIRRVLIAEVPSIAFEKVFLYQNTSVIPDEVLCHRLGLLPIYVNPTHFIFPPPKDSQNDKENDVSEEPMGDPKENIIFELNVKCKKKKSAETTTTTSASSIDQDDVERQYENAVVRSKNFKWIPIGKQMKMYCENPPRIFSDDIVIAKLRPGQEIEARCHCVKGTGRDHAKFSPVATAAYRMLPEIRLLKTVTGADAELLKSSFTGGVIDIDAKTGAAFVKDARKDMCSRNVFQHEHLADAVYMGKNTEYFIFLVSVESTGAVQGQELVVDATRVIRAKLKFLSSLLKEKLCGSE